MAEPTTPNLGLTIPNTGDLVNAWGPVINGDLSLLDALAGSSTSIALASSNVTLSTAQTQNYSIVLTGSLSANISITVPQASRGYFFRDTTTRNGYAISVVSSLSGAASQALPTGFGQIYIDPSFDAHLTNHRAEIGEIKPFAGLQSAGVGILPPLYLPCDGSAVSRTNYSNLFYWIGTGYGSGDGSTTFNLPDLRGRTVFSPDDGAGRLTSASGFGSSSVGTAGGDELLQSHNHGVTDPGHTHGVNDPGHNHAQTPHSHTATDAGHGHVDAGHVHGIGTATTGGGSGGTVGVFGSATTSNTGIGYAQIQTGFANVSIGSANANISSAFTGVSTQTATTSISVNSNGSGASQNMPPAILIPWIIYAGQ